ncbi:MAG: SDR family NAD(P)-dependent oxidoreductase [Myxococcota bacterium]
MPREPRKRTVIVTGANSGLGFQAARTLAADPQNQLILAGRNEARIAAAAKQLSDEGGSVTARSLDLASIASIRSFTAGLSPAWTIDAVVANAGVSPASHRQTVDGFDLTFGVNHLGHFLLVHLLTKRLQANARLVFVSSGTHNPEHSLARALRVPAPNYTRAVHLAYPDEAPPALRIDKPPQRYSTSKLCNVLFAYELARQAERLGKQWSVFVIDPGLMPGTGLARDFPAPLRTVFFSGVWLASPFVAGIRSPKRSGRDLADLVTNPALEGRTGLYFDGSVESRSSKDSYDVELALDLWNTSSELTGIRDDETVLPIQLSAHRASTTSPAHGVNPC